MFSRELTMEEFAHGIYLAGIAQYNQFLHWFRKRGIGVNFENLLFVVGLINAKMVDKVLKDERIKIEGNLEEIIIKELNETVPVDMSQIEREEVAKYIQTVNDRIQKILDTEDETFLYVTDYFISETATEKIDNDEIKSDLKYEFKEWQYNCYDLIRKFKM